MAQGPTRHQTASSSEDVKNRAAARDPSRAILVVDDEENFLTLLHWFLTQKGYQVTTASSEGQARAQLDGRSFDIALLDIRLGSGDGLDLLDELTRRVPGIKVFMMTAYPTVNSIKRAFDKGALRYLTKPVDLQELAEALRLLD